MRASQEFEENAVLHPGEGKNCFHRAGRFSRRTLMEDEAIKGSDGLLEPL
jgi:hypothetical protein